LLEKERMLPKLEKIKGIHPGYILKRELKTRGLKSNELAKSINEHKQTISAIINHKRKITPTLSIKLANIFNIEQDYFMLLQASYEVKSVADKHLKTSKPDLSKFREVIFWDTNIRTINWEKQKRAVIQRVLERGNGDEVEEMIRFYGKQKVSEEVEHIDNSILPRFQQNIALYKL